MPRKSLCRQSVRPAHPPPRRSGKDFCWASKKKSDVARSRGQCHASRSLWAYFPHLLLVLSSRALSQFHNVLDNAGGVLQHLPPLEVVAAAEKAKSLR